MVRLNMKGIIECEKRTLVFILRKQGASQIVPRICKHGVVFDGLQEVLRGRGWVAGAQMLQSDTVGVVGG